MMKTGIYVMSVLAEFALGLHVVYCIAPGQGKWGEMLEPESSSIFPMPGGGVWWVTAYPT